MHRRFISNGVRRHRIAWPPVDVRPLDCLLPAEPRRGGGFAALTADRRLVLLSRADRRGVPRSHRHPGAGHHPLPRPALGGGGAADRAAPGAGAERDAGRGPLRNLSLFGLSFVTLTFVDGVDGLAARAQVLERLREAELPEGVVPQLGPFATPIGEVYRYTLEGAGGDPRLLRTLQDWVVRPALLRSPGVADVVSYGGLVREIHVQPDPMRLASFGLTLDELESEHQGRLAQRHGGRAGAGERAAGHPQRRAVPRPGGRAVRQRRQPRRHAGVRQGRGRGERGVGPAAGGGQPRRSTSTPSRASSSCAGERTPRWF